MSFKIISILSLFCFISCAAIAPTPWLMGDLVELNNNVHTLYLDCSEGANYIPLLDNCNPQTLETATNDLLNLSENFISADITQPQGYDIHLEASLIFFRISERNANEYTRAEQIARQFFEIQKASSGSSLDTARFYWVWFTAANSSFQYYGDIEMLNAARKVDLLVASSEGADLMLRIRGTRANQLGTAMDILGFIIFYIGD